MDNLILIELIPVSMGLTITLVAFLVTYITVRPVIHLADRFGIVDIPDKRRIHSGVIPRAGGVAIYIGVITACFFAVLLSPLISDKPVSITWTMGMFIGSGLIFLTGLVDDLIGLKAPGKLIGQISAVSVAYYFGIQLQILSGYSLPGVFDYIFTVLWFLLIINAFNLIDGIDGLAAGIAGISALGIAGFLIQRNLHFEAAILFAVVGAAMGFFRFNRNPASIFLGDSGSNFLGFFMAAMMISTGSKSSTIGYLWAPLLAVIVPAADLFLAVWRRTLAWILDKLEGRDSTLRIMTGDLEHLHHRLLRLNIHPRDVAALLCLINALFVLGGLMAFPYKYQGWGILIVCISAVGFLASKYIITAEVQKSIRIIYRTLASPSKPLLALFCYILIDFISIYFSLLVSIRISHPDFPIPVVFSRASTLIAYWLPVGLMLVYFVENNTSKRKIRITENKMLAIISLTIMALTAAGFLKLLEIISPQRAISNLIIYTGMSFLMLVLCRYSLAIIEKQFSERIPEDSFDEQETEISKGMNNLKFYSRLV